MLTLDYFQYITKPKCGLVGPWSLNNILQSYILVYVCEHVYVCVVCLHAWGGMGYDTCMKVRGQLAWVLVFYHVDSRVKLSGPQAWWQAPLSPKPSHWPLGEHFLHLKFFLEKEDVHKFEDSLGYEWDPISKNNEQICRNSIHFSLSFSCAPSHSFHLVQVHTKQT